MSLHLPSTGIVSFSLYGRNPTYCQGAIENLELVKQHYPGWQAIYHVKDAHQDTINALRDGGAIVVHCGYANMMMARFLPFFSSGVVLSRDCDSRIDEREVRTVLEWLETDKPRHAIRDHRNHVMTRHHIMGGLWGSRKPLSEYVRKSLLAALEDLRWSGWGSDQEWLRQNVWEPDDFFISQYDKTPWMKESWSADRFCGMRHAAPGDAKQVVTCEGFFNRLNGLVNAELAFGSDYDIRWAINPHLPHRFEDLFQHVEGIGVVNDGGLNRHPRNTDPAKPLCHYYLNPSRDVTREEVEESYRKVIGRLGIEARKVAPLGIHYRGHHFARLSPFVFAGWCLDWAKERGVTRCFVVADSERDAIGSILSEGGMEVAWGESPPMTHDFDRSSLEDLKKFIADGLTLAECDTVLTSFAESTVTDTARAFGREVLTYSGGRSPKRCWFHRTSTPPPAPLPTFPELLAKLDQLRSEDNAQYLYGTHIETLHGILEILNPAPTDTLLEFGGGNFSTPLLIATGARVVTVEQGQAAPQQVNEWWRDHLEEAYRKHPNWSLVDAPGASSWRLAELPANIRVCFVDGEGHCRKDVVQNMLGRGVPVVAAHDSEAASYRYNRIATPANYAAFDFIGREAWTRVWSADPAVTSMMDLNPLYRRVP